MLCRTTLCLLALCLAIRLTSPAPALAADQAPGFSATVQPFFTQYCLRCHNGEKAEGELRLDTLSHDFTDMLVAQRWAEVLFRINSGEMPPADEPQPPAKGLGETAEWIAAQVSAGRAARMAQRGPVSHYRLSRDEYAHTVYDMLGVHFDARQPGALNEDPRWHGFDRVGSMLTLSPSHVNRYLDAADTILEQAFPVREPKTVSGQEDAGENRWLLFPSRQHGNINIREPGLYRIRVKLSALPSFQGRMPRLSIWSSSLKRSIAGQDVIAAEQEPKEVQFETFLPAGRYQLINEAPGMLSDGHTLSHTPRTIQRLEDLNSARPTAYKFLNEQGQSIFPLLLIDSLSWEGPLQLDVIAQKREGLYPASESDPAELRACLRRFIDRAWRRPATAAEVDRYVKLVESELAVGEKFRPAYLAALTGVLASKNFTYLVEGTPTARRDRLTDWELASRLSYFLWSSLPDEQLSAAARQGTLHEPQVLRSQLHRMLADERIDRFTDTFPQQWLQLHRVGMFPPDSELFPDYDKWLEQSMVLETTGFFAEVFDQNLSIREFLASDWTIMNSRLAMHYGLDRASHPAVDQPGFHRVAMGPADHRGGLLTQASVLSLTSDGVRHRPVHRGVWVSEAIFGRTPSPPPPNVEPLAPTPSDQPKATIRQQLEAHTTHATCNSCHRNIDPLGFAFDNYDAIGRWRQTEQTTGGQGDNPPINATGELPDGRAYQGPDQFKQLLADDVDRFAEAFVEQLATFALRRVMTIDDAAELQAIVAASKQDDYRLRTVIEQLVLSDLFQKR
ncbi:DUF1592 domain-containing protein [Lignipirellula cremea]|nr:DUF1592 domain-containing protein [Lignipirellula cremea]